MTFIPYCSERGTVDLTAADAAFKRLLEDKLVHMRRLTTRWVPSLQFIAQRRPEMHWCAYDDGRVVAFLDLSRNESFAELTEIYEFVSEQVRFLKSLGSYKGDFIDEPDPKDDTDIHWRVWEFKAGESQLHLNCGFALSGHCRIVVDGTETQVIEKKRVICDGGDLQAA